MFPYNPKDAERAWPEGQYVAQIEDVVEGKSKSSNQPMLTITYLIYDDRNDRQQKLNDYITQAATYKLKYLALALGQSVDFEQGIFDAAGWVNSKVLVHLKVENDPQFGDKNKISKVVALEPSTVVKSMRSMLEKPIVKIITPHTAVSEDDIPF